MPYEKTVKLINMLEKKTSEGRVEWQETTDDGVFQAAFPGYAVRVLMHSAGGRFSDEDPDYFVQLYNENGTLIEVIRQDDIREGEEADAYKKSYGVLKSLYEGARRHAMGVDRALDQILEQLENDVPF